MAPPQGQMRPGRQLAVLGLIFAILYLLVFFAADSKLGIKDRLEPRLGLDLVGGTRVTFEARTLDGGVPPENSLEQARQIIEERVNALGVSEAEVVIEGNQNIVVSKAGQGDDALKEVGEAAQLRFRKVLKTTADAGTPAADPSAAPSGAANPAATPTPAPAEATAQPSGPAGGQGGGAVAPAPSGSATPTPSASASAPTGAVPGQGQSIEQRRAAVQQKVGAAAWAAATALQAPATDPAQLAVFAPFGKLTPAEVAALTPEMQFNVPTISCAQLDKRPPGSIQDENQLATGCARGQKNLMDKAKVVGTDVSNAAGVLDQTSGEWVVSLDFSSKGQDKWTALTKEAFNNEGGACDASAVDENRCRVAVVLDNRVISDPTIQGVLTGQSQITGQFTSKDANQLANQLKYGALPVTFAPQEAQTISATLGTKQLQAGLLAAGIGMLLVAVYAFFYYRLLGSVIFLSLILSALLTFGALILLGRQIGFTLTLAGIAGFIVSLGVAADSFVIYFERLKDEIREGRSPRSAVPRAWVRARRTIISANAITIMAAVVLYIVSVGVVQGFAFALGLSTVLDLIVVFLFRHPIMTMFARTKAFLSPRVSGLGRVLQRDGDADEPAAPRTSRVKEA